MVDRGIEHEETALELPQLSNIGENHWYDIYDASVMQQGGIDITRRIKDLVIRIDYWDEAKEKRSRSKQEFATIDESGPSRGIGRAIEPYRVIPFDIVSCILLHLPDLRTLASAIFVNRTFATSFEAARVSITRTILISMFGEEVLDHALILAWLLNDYGRTTSLAEQFMAIQPESFRPIPSSHMRSLIEIHQVTNIWIEIWETRKIWTTKKLNFGPRIILLDHSRSRLSRAVVMFWAYTICARQTVRPQNTIQHDDNHSVSKVMLEERDIFDYFTHFELLETRVLYEFYSDIAFIATNEYRKSNLTVDPAWRYLATERGPAWMLRMLALDGVDDPITNENPGPFESPRFNPDFFWLHAAKEKLKRGLQAVPAGFTGKKRRQMVDALMRRGMDGDDGSIRGSGSYDVDEVAEAG